MPSYLNTSGTPATGGSFEIGRFPAELRDMIWDRVPQSPRYCIVLFRSVEGGPVANVHAYMAGNWRGDLTQPTRLEHTHVSVEAREAALRRLSRPLDLIRDLGGQAAPANQHVLVDWGFDMVYLALNPGQQSKYRLLDQLLLWRELC